jgi:hypothetical protein
MLWSSALMALNFSTSIGFANGTGTQAPGSNLSGGNFLCKRITGLAPATAYYYMPGLPMAAARHTALTGSFTTVTPTLSGSALTAFGNVCTGQTAGPNTFTITGTNLTTADVNSCFS